MQLPKPFGARDRHFLLGVKVHFAGVVSTNGELPSVDLFGWSNQQGLHTSTVTRRWKTVSGLTNSTKGIANNGVIERAGSDQVFGYSLCLQHVEFLQGEEAESIIAADDSGIRTHGERGSKNTIKRGTGTSELRVDLTVQRRRETGLRDLT